jgi:multiple sugar transport system ATP-binding protein
MRASAAPFAGRKLIVGIRPEVITQPNGRPHAAPILANVDIVEPLGLETLLYFSIGNEMVCARVDPDTAPSPRSQAKLSVDMDKVHLFDPQTEQALRP